MVRRCADARLYQTAAEKRLSERGGGARWASPVLNLRVLVPYLPALGWCRPPQILTFLSGNLQWSRAIPEKTIRAHVPRPDVDRDNERESGGAREQEQGRDDCRCNTLRGGLCRWGVRGRVLGQSRCS